MEPETFLAFQRTMTPSRGRGEQKYKKCTRMSNRTLVLLFVRSEAECEKGLLTPAKSEWDFAVESCHAKSGEPIGEPLFTMSASLA